MRLIDADALDFGFPMPDDFNGMMKQIGIKMAEARVMNAPTIEAAPVVHGRWIPVVERMPEKEGSYLIWTTIYFTPDHVDECNHYDGMVIADFHPEFGFMGRAGVNAKAWMPLPEPPKEDGA